MKYSTLIKAELKKLISNKRNLISNILLVIFWTLVVLPQYARIESTGGASSTMIYISSIIGIFVCLMFSNVLFLNEKREKSIETVLSSPLNLKELWLVKTISATIPSIVASWSSVILLIFSSRLMANSFILPSIETFGYVLIVLPLTLLAMIGILGYIQFMFGMKENRIFNMVFMVAIFLSFNFINAISSQNGGLSWLMLLIILGISGLLMFIMFHLTKFLNKEKIITSLED